MTPVKIISQHDMQTTLEHVELFKMDMIYDGHGAMSVSFDGRNVNLMFPMTHWSENGETIENPAIEKLDFRGVSRIFINYHDGTDYEYVAANGNWEVFYHD